MKIQKIPFDQIPQLSLKDKAYVQSIPDLEAFYTYKPSLETFEQVIKDKKQDNTDREFLSKVLSNQYDKVETTKQVLDNIRSLKDRNTFTVTTAHQPSVLTGPLYYIYKIISTIRLSEELNAKYSKNHFVPVFISSGEDHDFEEVSKAHLFGKTIKWENNESGSVGKMKTASLISVLEELKNILGTSEQAKNLFNLISHSYQSNERYADATFHLVNELFKHLGLVIVNTNDAQLKRVFIPIAKEELLNRPSQAFIQKAAKKLEAIGLSGQAHAREINLFYLNAQIRERIIFENDQYQVLNTDIRFSEEEILAELEQQPEYFSPNVILRPLYQEKLLPNLAYIGGGGEIAYWLERKEQFKHFGINFPMLVRRNSVLWIDKGASKKMEKLQLETEDIFRDTEELIKEYVKKNTEQELSLDEEKRLLLQAFSNVISKAGKIDQGLLKTAKAEQAKQLKSLGILEGKLLRAEKQRHEIAVNQIRKIKEKLFPGNGLQERYDNFLPFYLKHGAQYFSTLKEHLDPLEDGFVVIREY